MKSILAAGAALDHERGTWRPRPGQCYAVFAEEEAASPSPSQAMCLKSTPPSPARLLPPPRPVPERHCRPSVRP